MSDVTTYNPNNILIDFDGGDLTQGIAKGVFVKVSRNSDMMTESVGSGGEVTVVESNDNTGTVVITLKQTSAANDIMSAKAALRTKGPLLLKDLGGRTLVHSEKAWIKKFADIEFGNEDSVREWTLTCADLEEFVGGASA